MWKLGTKRARQTRGHHASDVARRVPNKKGIYVKRIVIATILTFWAVGTETYLIRSVYIPSPSDLVNALIGMLFPTGVDPADNMLFRTHSFVEHFLLSVIRLYTGYVIGSVVGIYVGMWFGNSVWWAETVKGSTNLTGVIPKTAVLGLFAVNNLLGTEGVISTVALVSYYVAANGAISIANDPKYERSNDAGRALGMSRTQVLVAVSLPVAVEPMEASLRVGLWWSIGVLYIAEWIIAPNGMGKIYNVMVANSQIAEMYVVIISVFTLSLPGYIALPLLGHVMKLPRFFVEMALQYQSRVK